MRFFFGGGNNSTRASLIMHRILLIHNPLFLSYIQQLGTVGGGWPTVKYQVVITDCPWLGRGMAAQDHGGGQGGNDCQPFSNSTKVCPLHYLQSTCVHHSPAIFFVVHSFGFFSLEGLQNPDQEYQKFH